MKIGIVTLWDSNDNYGQQLQCWALQRYLEKKGHNPYLIRYSVKGRYYRGLKGQIKHFIEFVLYFLKYNSASSKLIRKNEKREFSKFRTSSIKMSKTIYSSLEQLKNNPPIADSYIVGSDQVWAHLLNNKENEAFFLNFGEVTTRRYAYAASFSMDTYPLELEKALKENLLRFDGIGVREESGVNICSKVNVTAQQVVDPTLLLNMQEYMDLCKYIPNNKEKKNVYIYTLNISNAEDIEWSKLKDFAKQRDFKITATSASGYFPAMELFENVEYKYATIPEWIVNIKNAEFVVTTSFHGVVFCLLLHTPFIYFPLKGKHSRGNNRVTDLLVKLDLSELIWDDRSTYENKMKKTIDWDIIDDKLNLLKESSENYITKMLTV